MTRNRDEAGAVTAETATVIPVLVVVTAALTWVVAFGVTEVRAADAARETARSAARGDDVARSVELGRQIAPAGSRIDVEDDAEEVIVTVTSTVRGPLGLFGLLPAHQVQARAVAAREPS